MGETLGTSEIINLLETSHSPLLFHGERGVSYINLREGEKQRTLSLFGQAWNNWFNSFLRKKNIRIGEYRREEVTEELIAMANEGPRHKTYVRVARRKDDILIDLGDETHKAVRIRKDGFKIVNPKSVFFLRPIKQQSIPRPIEVGNKEFLKIFKKWFPVEGDLWILILAFILKAFDRDFGSYAILVLEGEQGSGKSTLSRRIKRIIDPSEPDFFSPPNSQDDIIVASMSSFLLVFDNISGIDHRMADTFCRLSTGGGVSKRKLYEDHEEMSYEIHRPVIINGIDEPTNRADFTDRSITIELKQISNELRISEMDLKARFEEDLPQILGGVFGLLSQCLNELPNIQTTGLPRMTEYARMGIAIEKCLGLESGFFLQIYENKIKEQSENDFWNNDLCAAIFKNLEKMGGISGTAQDIRTTIFRERGTVGNGPRTAKAFSSMLKRAEPLLKSKGIKVSRPPRTSKARIINIEWINPEDRVVKDRNSRTFPSSKSLASRSSQTS